MFLLCQVLFQMCEKGHHLRGMFFYKPHTYFSCYRGQIAGLSSLFMLVEIQSSSLRCVFCASQVRTVAKWKWQRLDETRDKYSSPVVCPIYTPVVLLCFISTTIYTSVEIHCMEHFVSNSFFPLQFWQIQYYRPYLSFIHFLNCIRMDIVCRCLLVLMSCCFLYVGVFDRPCLL